MDPPYPTPEVGCWSGGARVGRRHLSSSRAPTPARRSGRVSSRHDPSDVPISSVVDFAIPLPRRGAGAFIVSAVGHSYLVTLLPLWLTMPSCPSTTPVVLAVGRASADPGDLAERVNSGTNPGDLAERVNSGTNPRDLAERVNSGTNPGERVNSGTNPGDLAERVNSGTNPRDLAKRVNSGTNPGDLAERVGMTSSDSSSSVRVVSSPGSEETSLCDPEVGSSGASSGPPSPVDARVLRDLEVMKSDHDLDTTMTEGSLVVIRERYSIPIEYELHVPQPG
ncbi:hypothetical protein B296_00039651 [Ensete ventricosum]|uniref:Uncharacterized protein n=1 Tax=Ensete ventricosum TaxID=4639 RepID=A0A426YC54_ENSVE|nr:hypothetical protein B296_00039651 [Ensete ventricosum]